MGFLWLDDTPQNWALGVLQTGRESERGKANDYGTKGNEIMHGIDLGL